MLIWRDQKRIKRNEDFWRTIRLPNFSYKFTYILWRTLLQTIKLMPHFSKTDLSSKEWMFRKNIDGESSSFSIYEIFNLYYQCTNAIPKYTMWSNHVGKESIIYLHSFKRTIFFTNSITATIVCNYDNIRWKIYFLRYDSLDRIYGNIFMSINELLLNYLCSSLMYID